MKSRILFALPLAAALMVPAYAQQDTGSSSNQSTPAVSQGQAQSAGQTSSDPNADIRQPLKSERHEGFWGKINPMARKKYVQRQMDPIRNRVNELDELTASNGKAIKDVDARAQEGIRLASAKATEADQHAVDAGNRAQAANTTAEQASSRLQTVQTAVTNIDQYQTANQTEIRLRPGQTALSKNAKDALDQLAESVKGQNAYLIEVQGFSGGRGNAAIESSQKMAQSVVRYLVLNHEIPVYRIYLLGMGNAPQAKAAEGGKAASRGSRVEVSLLKNPNLEQLQNSGASSAAPGTQGGASGTAAQPSGQSQNEGTATQAPASGVSQPSQVPQPPKK